MVLRYSVILNCTNSGRNIQVDRSFRASNPMAPVPVGPRSESTYSDESVAGYICLFRFCNDRAKTHPCRQSLSEPFTISCYLQVLGRYTAVDI